MLLRDRLDQRNSNSYRIGSEISFYESFIGNNKCKIIKITDKIITFDDYIHISKKEFEEYLNNKSWEVTKY